MCGIAAIFNYGQSKDNTDFSQWLTIAGQALSKRGPDDEGTWFSEDGRIGLCHRRLAIIDPTIAGRQPMVTSDRQLCIAYNGEIYNYKELRHDLQLQGCRFQSNSDTEVILQLYREEGTASLRRLRGMYAFALWDERRQELLLARDPFGIKPLYYSVDGRTIRVASQVKSLLAAGVSDTSPESAGHVGFFLWGYVPEPFTLYKGIRSLPAGSILWVKKDDSNFRHQIYYSLPEQLSRVTSTWTQPSKDEIRMRLKTAIENSVEHHMVADVPVGIFLSSGLDSTTIASMAAQLTTSRIRSITLGFKPYKGNILDETVLAECIAKRLNCIHETRWISQKDFIIELPNIFVAMDQPSIDGVNTYFISKFAREAGIKVVLSGIGGDELLGGYPSFHQVPLIASLTHSFSYFGKPARKILAPLLSRFTSPKFASLFEYGGTLGGAYLLRRGLFMPWELDDILDPDMIDEGLEKLNPITNLNAQVSRLHDDYLSVSALETILYMQNMLLRDTDWASMAHSVEVRLPLVDVELISSVASLLCYPKKPNKRTLANAAWEQIPQELLIRPKTGFSFPTRKWILDSTIQKERGLRGWARIVYNEFQKAR